MNQAPYWTLVPNPQSGGVLSVASELARAASRTPSSLGLLFIRGADEWINKETAYPIDSLRQDGKIGRHGRTLHRWIEDHCPQVIAFNDIRQCDHVIPHVASETKVVYVVHDSAPSYWAHAIKMQADIDAFVAVSQFVAQRFRHMLHQPTKLSVIHNGIDPPPATGPIRTRDVVFLQGDKWAKGADDVLMIWRELSKAGFEGRLLWMGTVGSRMQKRISRLPNSPSVVLLGRLPRADALEHLASADALLMLSKGEPFGMVTVEAMTRGCRPIGWNSASGTLEILGKFASTCLVQDGDTRSLVKRIMLQDDDELKGLRAQLLARANLHFSSTRMWDNYHQLFESLATSSRAPRSRDGRPVGRDSYPMTWRRLIPAPLKKQFGSIRSNRFIGKHSSDHRG